uniref:non-specific serine/threonine protein kinase n=1 Tax=Fagus sylvatica TaxID=28930 RepID=A0A2N9F294_FAGSY
MILQMQTSQSSVVEREISAQGIVYEDERLIILWCSIVLCNSIQKNGQSVMWGCFLREIIQSYVENTLAQVIGTKTPELYQYSRMSPGSLRYYGLGLDNGLYNVSLFFAETGFDARSSQTWKSLGRRVFNIYIQVGLKEQFRRILTANVSENYLEIHLFWAGKGTCCIPVQGYYGPLISAIHVASDFVFTVPGILPSTPGEKSKFGLIVGIAVPVGVVTLILIFAVFYMKRKSLHHDEDEFLGMGPRPNTFSYAELRSATEDFNPSNKLGEGGFGPVFKGTLSDGRIVAVKQLSVTSHQGKSQFVTEISTISAVQHRNLVKLYGYCIDGDRRLLEKVTCVLNWPTRFSVCLGTARGLAYLHEESRPRIVHRDVKASNILIDGELCPKISDFGLAKLYDDTKTHIKHPSCRDHAWTLHENNRSLRLVDPTLTEFDEGEVARVIAVSFLCIQASPMMRPSMSRVVAMLAGDIEIESNVGDNSNSNNQLGDPTPSPLNVIETMLGGIIGDGR